MSIRIPDESASRDNWHNTASYALNQLDFGSLKHATMVLAGIEDGCTYVEEKKVKASHETAIALVFLMDGFNAEHKKHNAEEPYETHANIHSGYIGIVSDFAEYAEWLEFYLDLHYISQNFPGVFHYEVTETLGSWLFQHPNATTYEFRQHAARVIGAWFADGLAAQAHPVDGVAYLRNLPPAADTPVLVPTLPPTQPKVSTPRTTKVPMKLQALIKALKVVRDSTDDGRNLDVVIRGSKPKGIADIRTLKTAKNSKRGAFLVIDKLGDDSAD